jgi:hypothetical protein
MTEAASVFLRMMNEIKVRRANDILITAINVLYAYWRSLRHFEMEEPTHRLAFGRGTTSAWIREAIHYPRGIAPSGSYAKVLAPSLLTSLMSIENFLFPIPNCCSLTLSSGGLLPDRAITAVTPCACAVKMLVGIFSNI